MNEPSAWWLRSRAARLRKRAGRIASGEALSALETTKLLRLVALDLEHVARFWEEMKRRAETAEAWIEGFKSGSNVPYGGNKEKK